MKEKKELNTTQMPHDKGYKRSLSQPKEFLHFLKKYVGADWMMELQESQLSLCDKEFVDKDYEGREADILSTNTVLDNIMFCDKFRKKTELAEAVRIAYNRIQELGNQEKEEFNNWVKGILLSICGDKEAVLEEILNWAGNGVDDMAFKYNIIKAFEDERAEGKAEGKAESIIELLEEVGEISDKLRQNILEQKNLDILKKWIKKAAQVQTIEEFETFLNGEE